MATSGSSALKPAKRQRLADLAHEAIRDAIIRGRYTMGERLVETRLAAELEMSRAPLREALRQMVEEGLLEERPHQGIFVATVSAQDIVDLYNVRLPVEVAGLRLFMRRGASTKRLWRSVERMAAVAERPREFLREDLAFHTEIGHGSGNELLMSLHERLAGRLTIALGDIAFPDAPDLAPLHAAIVSCVDRGNEAAAVDALLDSFGQAPQLAVEHFGGDPSLILPMR